MKLKTTEELILDFIERYDAFDFKIEIEHRDIDGIYKMLWFTVTAEITNNDPKHQYEHYIPVKGESYTLDNAIGELNSNARSYKAPKMWPKRIKVNLKDFQDIDNVVMYKEKP